MSEHLKQGLEELQTELKRIDSESPTLQKLAGEVTQAMEQPEEVSHTLLFSLQQTTEEFEVNHPELTALANNVMTSLSALGI